MIGTLLVEGLKDALPLIAKFAPSLSAVISHSPHIASHIILPILATAFGSDSGDIHGLVDKITTSPDSQTLLEKFEAQHGIFLKDYLNEIRPLISAKINIELEWDKDNS